MFLVTCSDINDTLCEDCEELMKQILDRVGDHVFHQMAPKISQEVKQIKEDLAQKAGDSKSLVRFMKRLENVKNEERKRLMNEYNDLIEWLMMLNRNPRYKLQEENIKPVTFAYGYINDIGQIIEGAEQKQKQESLEIEKALFEQISTLQRDITEVEGQVNEFKDNDMIRKAPKYSEQIEEIKKTLLRLTKEMEHIHAQQADLDLALNEYPVLIELKTKIKPYDDLWKLRNQFDAKCMNEWLNSPLGKLDPEAVQQEFTQMF